jgi:hypothetical protein
MDILIPLASLAIFAIGVVVLYFRFRDNVSDLAAATDSKKSSGFWAIVALIYAIVIAILFSVFHVGYAFWRW